MGAALTKLKTSLEKTHSSVTACKNKLFKSRQHNPDAQQCRIYNVQLIKKLLNKQNGRKKRFVLKEKQKKQKNPEMKLVLELPLQKNSSYYKHV